MDYAELPLGFVPNRGQHHESVRFAAQGAGFAFFFTKREAVLSFSKGKRSTALALRFLGASPGVRLEVSRRLVGKVNYVIGSDRARWHTNLSTYGELRYRGLWPGIDLVLRGANGQLKYEFHVAPGAHVSAIRLAYRGASLLAVARSGALKIRTPLGVITDTAPRSYQQVAETQVAVPSSYSLKGRRGYGFALGGYDRSRPLVIDPGLLYSTFLGGSAGEAGYGLAVDPSGSAYVTGYTFSGDFPTMLGSFDPSHNGDGDAFVTKLDPSGSTLLYSTYLGGGSFDQGASVVLDSSGNAHVVGQTMSADFPTTLTAYDTSLDGPSDGFVAKLGSTGSALVYSTYLGGSSFDAGEGITLDASGNAYVGGLTDSADFPTTLGAFDSNLDGGRDAFVTKLNPTGSAPLLYSTYLGGSGREEGGATDVAVDPAGAAYVTGTTDSGDFPTTPGAFDMTHNGGRDAFVTKFDPAGATLVYSTYLGGGGSRDEGYGITLDAAANAYVAGLTDSGDFPTTLTAFDPTFNGSFDAWVTKLNTTGSALAYSTYLGGSAYDDGRSVALDQAGSAHITGSTDSADFPTTSGAFDTTFNGGGQFGADAYVTKLDPTGSALTYSTYLGGGNSDMGHWLEVDSTGSLYVSGGTDSADFPITPGAFDTAHNGARDVFVLKLDTGATPPPPPPCPSNDDEDDDGLNDRNEWVFGTLLGDHDSDDDGVADGNEDSDDDGEDDEDEDDDDDCPDEDEDNDGEDDEDEDDD